MNGNTAVCVQRYTHSDKNLLIHTEKFKKQQRRVQKTTCVYTEGIVGQNHVT